MKEIGHRSTNEILYRCMLENPIPRDVWESQMEIFDARKLHSEEKLVKHERVLPVDEIVSLCRNVVSRGYTKSEKKKEVYANALSSAVINTQHKLGSTFLANTLNKNHSTVIYYFQMMDIDTLKYNKPLLYAWGEVKRHLNIRWDYVYTGRSKFNNLKTK